MTEQSLCGEVSVCHISAHGYYSWKIRLNKTAAHSPPLPNRRSSSSLFEWVLVCSMKLKVYVFERFMGIGKYLLLCNKSRIKELRRNPVCIQGTTSHRAQP